MTINALVHTHSPLTFLRGRSWSRAGVAPWRHFTIWSTALDSDSDGGMRRASAVAFTSSC